MFSIRQCYLCIHKETNKIQKLSCYFHLRDVFYGPSTRSQMIHHLPLGHKILQM